MSGTTLEPSSNDHLKAEEVIEERRDSTIEPSPPSEQFGSKDVFTEIPNQSSSVESVLNLEPDPFMKQYHTVIIEVFLNPHMNLNCLPKSNIPLATMCLTIVCLNQTSHL